MKTIFEANHANLNDGGFPIETIAFFEKLEDAETVARRPEYCVQGLPQHPGSAESRRVFSSVEEFDEFTGAKLKAQALSKLSEREKRALGL